MVEYSAGILSSNTTDE
jgi:hypothetical protein